MDAFYFCGDALNVKTWFLLGPYRADLAIILFFTSECYRRTPVEKIGGNCQQIEGLYI